MPRQDSPTNAPPELRPWEDQAVPLESRGVSRQWLIDFVRNAWIEINAARELAIQEAESARSHNAAWAIHQQPDLPIPRIPPFYFLNTRGLVYQVIKPMTASIRAPLYALVPEQFKGRPTTFVSHPWSSLLLGPERQRIGTPDALEYSDAEFVWVDFACRNQHTSEATASDMLRVIRSIGSLSVCATPTPVYTRCWCLWELFCAQQAETSVSLLVRPGYRNDKIISVNTLYRSFKGIERAESSVPHDRELILKECLSHFGSIERADGELERIIRERFASSWHELQDKNEPMKFSPSPWVAGAGGVAPVAFEPYYEPGLLDSTMFGSERTVREGFADAGVYLGAAEMERLAALRAEADWNKSVKVQELFKCLLRGDVAGVKQQLELGGDPEAVVGDLTPITLAARQGAVAILELLIAAGAKVDPTNTSYSPLRLAAENGHHEVVQLLLRHGAAVDSPAGENAWTALMWAASSGHIDIVKTLLEKGAAVDHEGSGKKCRALHLAAQNGKTEVVSTLVAQGAAIDACEFRGLTALHLAAYNGCVEIVRILLTHGADRTIKGARGETALELAEERGQRPVVEVMLSGQ